MSLVEFADDMATCCSSKGKLDKTLSIAHQYSLDWQYEYNAKKCAVMVYGETRNELNKFKKFRYFILGKEKIKERVEYDHVGVKNCLFHNYKPRVEERISKGRKAFNSILNVGIRKNDFNMSVITYLFWSIIVPLATYGGKVWVLRRDEIEMLRKFQ